MLVESSYIITTLISLKLNKVELLNFANDNYIYVRNIGKIV